MSHVYLSCLYQLYAKYQHDEFVCVCVVVLLACAQQLHLKTCCCPRLSLQVMLMRSQEKQREGVMQKVLASLNSSADVNAITVVIIIIIFFCKTTKKILAFVSIEAVLL